MRLAICAGGCPTVAAAISWTVLVLGGYASGGGLLPFLLARRSIRIRKAGRAVELASIDAMPMAMSGFVLWAIGPLLLVLGTKTALIGGAVSVVAWFGFRLTVHVSPTRTRVVRKAAFFLPWSWRVYRDPPHAFTDGWGDFADPEAVNLELGEGKRKIELAWGDKHSGTRCEDLAAEFNVAVAALGR